MNNTMLHALAEKGIDLLYEHDRELYGLLEAELQRQRQTLVLVASCSVVDPSVLACQSSTLVNVTAEGYPSKRYHAGCQIIDEIERMGIERAKSAFGAQYVNLQPHSATTANYIVTASLLNPGDTILGMELQYGGHLTHGARVAFAGRYFRAFGYGLTADQRIDYDQVAELAHEFRPRLMICGATAYPRTIDFARFRAIADSVGAWLLADISHTAGLVATGLHPNPIDHAHITTTCTHKQLYGPRGGLIMMGRDYAMQAPDGKQTLAELLQRATFPFMQGAPILNAMAAKVRALAMVQAPAFSSLARLIVENARALAGAFVELGYHVISGGTDNHIVLVNVAKHGLTGIIAERALEESGIIVNKNRIPGDQKSAVVTSGIRLGTNTAAARGMGPAEMVRCAKIIHCVLSTIKVINDREYEMPEHVRHAVRAEVQELCAVFSLPNYDISI